MFVSAFAESEGEQEGQRIGQLVRELVDSTCGDRRTHYRRSYLFTFVEKEKLSFLLSPVAVLPDYQRRGIGQNLIRYGLNQLRTDRVEFVATYGSPLYYSKVGFNKAISHEKIRPPFELSQPHGWIGQSLNNEPLLEVAFGSCTCVAAFNNPEYW